MKRILHELVQGSPAWHQFRLDHNGASESAAMLGLSKNVTRSELLRAKHTGIAKEFSDFVQERILNRGHEVEELARPMAEELLADELYPATYSFGRLSASCDGLTMDGLTAFEHKQWAEELAASVKRGELPEEHQPQCQQILLVTGAEQVLFMVSDGTPENCVHLFVRPDPAWFARIAAGWRQFDAALATYQPAEVVSVVTAAPVMALPAVSIQVKGEIALISNLPAFGAKLAAFIAGIDKTPSDDQGFADAEGAIKTLESAQTALEAAEAGALAQTATIDEMRRTVALYVDQARTKRLGKSYLPAIVADFGGVIKGMKTIASLHNAVDTELARAKIEANAIADRIEINLNSLRDLAKDHAFLFADAAQIVQKENDDLVVLIKVRISDHAAAEEKRLANEREKIRAEEVAKLERERLEQERKATAPPAAVT